MAEEGKGPSSAHGGEAKVKENPNQRAAGYIMFHHEKGPLRP